MALFAARFLSTPSARRATSCPHSRLQRLGISIHALREEGDINTHPYCLHMWKFLSTPSARRATHSQSDDAQLLFHFYPRPPRGGRPLPTGSLTIIIYFYPRPPRGGRRAVCDKLTQLADISIHALREEGDPAAGSGGSGRWISIHALREEGDLPCI